MKNFKIYIVYLIIFIFGFIVSVEGLKLSKVFVKNPLRSILATPNAYSQVTPKPLDQVEPIKQPKGTYNVLLLGHGGAGHSGGRLTDSIIVLHVNTNTHKATFISVPRDLWVTGNHKLNSAGINSFTEIEPVVTAVTGIPINYFVAVDFGGFVKIIDSLGGITAKTPNKFDDPYYPITGEENNTCGKTNDEVNALKARYSGYNLEIQFTCRYEHLHYEPGITNLDGTTALKYVRSRHGDSDFGRSARQFAVLKGITDKIISFQSLGKFDEIVSNLSQIVKTDLDLATIKSLVGVLGDPKAYTTNNIQLTTDNLLNNSKSSDGQFILIPKAGNFNFEGIKNYIKSNIN